MSQPKPWRPGWRRTGGNYALLSEACRALATIAHYRITVLSFMSKYKSDTNEIEDDIESEIGETVLLNFTRNGISFAIPFTHFTSKELAELKKIIDHAFTLASPIVAERDRVAEEAAKNGKDYYLRRHRSDPKASYFER